MRLRNWVVSVVLLAGLAGATGYGLAREPDSQSAVTSQQLFAEAMAREPGKEVNAQAYTFVGRGAALAYPSRRMRSPMWSRAISVFRSKASR